MLYLFDSSPLSYAIGLSWFSRFRVTFKATFLSVATTVNLSTSFHNRTQPISTNSGHGKENCTGSHLENEVTVSSKTSNNVRSASYMIPCFPANNSTDAHHCDIVSNRSSPSHFTKDSPFNTSQVTTRSTTKKINHCLENQKKDII